MLIIALVCHAWDSMIQSQTIFRSIFDCVKDVANTVKELEENKFKVMERKKVVGAYEKPDN